MVSTLAPRFSLAAYRVGAYRGGIARRVWAKDDLVGVRQPAPVVTASTHTVVAHWRPSVEIVTRGWPAGFYLFKLTASSGDESYVPFTVRSPDTAGRVALVAPVMDWEAYNSWGGYDLYQAPPGDERSWAVSFDRPYTGTGAGAFLYNVIGTAVLAERLGIPLAYETDVDVSAEPHLLDDARGFVSLGHDEYWTVPERRHVTEARDSGTDVAFLSSNDIYWRVRLQGASSGPDRLVVGYKSDASTADPMRLTHPRLTTGRWRDPPAADPENSLTGMLYECFPVDAPYRVASPGWWGFHGTGVRRGTEYPGLVADEADRVYPVASTPRPLQILSYVRYDCNGVTTSSESTYYTTPSGAGVIDFGTQHWACAVRPHCVHLPGVDDRFVRTVMTNVLRAFAAGPTGRTHPAQDNVDRFWLPRANEVPSS